MNFKSNNPFLGNKNFSKPTAHSYAQDQGTLISYDQEMTVSGTINKSLFMLLLLTATASVTWWIWLLMARIHFQWQLPEQ